MKEGAGREDYPPLPPPHAARARQEKSLPYTRSRRHRSGRPRPRPRLHRQPLSTRTELFLYLADRAEHVDRVIIPELESGSIVLCDRFHDSTVAYQGVGRGFGVEWTTQLCAFASAGLQPDLTFYLDIDPILGLSRVQRSKDRIEAEDIAFHQKIREAYLAIAKNEPDRFRVIDASRAPEQVYEEVCSQILSVIP